MSKTANREPIRRVNLDFAASTPMRPEAIEAQMAYDRAPLAGANPNSLHTLGRLAARELEGARRTVARSMGARVRSSEVVFTGGGTEANHLALLGLAEGARSRDRSRTRVIVSSIEHDSILGNLPALKRLGFTIDMLPATPCGCVEPEALAALIGDDVALVSVMFANNETGVLQPVAELAQIAREHGAAMHTDAIQGYLHSRLDVGELGVDAMSVAAHKVGGPVSLGALYVKGRTPLAPQILGGGQEAGRRAGTQDVRSAVAFAAVASELSASLDRVEGVVGERADALYRSLLACPSIHATMGDPFSVGRLPGIVSVYVDGFESEELILRLDQMGFEVSAGSACSSGSVSASHVLTAMGLPGDAAASSLRISFDDRVDQGDLDRFADALVSIAQERL